MGFKRKRNPFAERKRERKNKEANNRDAHPRHEEYNDIVKDNEFFIKYYQHQKICPDGEWEKFLVAIRSDLPTTFRVTGCKGESNALLEIIKGKFFTDYIKSAIELKETNNVEIEKPLSLPWYPNGLAWQLQLSRKDIRRSEAFVQLHNFLIAETSVGSISRQEAVSMIPPIVLDVQPHHKVLDMCAAPGSKTAQLIESLHSGPDGTYPSGFVIANDIDNNRCYMLVHQAKRLNSPCFLVINHDSANLPNMTMTNKNNEIETLKFDRILCDVPCSGDGTLRKNPDIWRKWNPLQATSLHGVQYRVAKRGAELLAIGGRLVYSTCSLNPVENEAVLHRLLSETDGALELVEVSDMLPGLKFLPGMTYWEPGTKDMTFYKSFSDVPETYHTILRPEMFPPNPNDLEKYNLHKCMRILPHMQNTGAFFVAVLEKRKLLPWETIPTPLPKAKIPDDGVADSNAKGAFEYVEHQSKRRRYGFKEDPFVFFKNSDADLWQSIKTFYQLNDDFMSENLLTRCLTGKKKNIYFCTEIIRDIVCNNENLIKIINTGVKTFARCDNKNTECAFRLAQEGLNGIDRFIGGKRRIVLNKDDLILLLQCNDPTKPTDITMLSSDVQKRVENISPGSCILEYQDEKISFTIVGWRGKSSLRAYIDSSETVHMLRLLGGDLSKYEKNKFKKIDENTTENKHNAVTGDSENNEIDDSTSVDGEIVKADGENASSVDDATAVDTDDRKSIIDAVSVVA